MAADGVSMAKFIENTGARIHRHDAILVMTPDFGTSDAENLDEQAACDLGYMVERLFPIDARGPIKPMIPWLTRLVGSILIHGAHAEAVSGPMMSRMMARAFTQAVHDTFDSWNARAEFLTAYPSWPYMAESMAKMATATARTAIHGQTMEGVAAQTRAVMATAFAEMDIAQARKAA